MTALRFFARYLYVPTLMLGLNGVAIYMMANGYPYLSLAIVILAAIGLSFAMERVLPYEETWNHGHDDFGKDAAHAVVYEVANLISLGILLLITLSLPAWHLWPQSLPFVVQFVLALLIADGVMTLVHFWSHRIGWLWKFHSIHHGVHRLYGFNGFVRHPLHQAIDLALGILPLVLIGLPVPVAAAIGIAVAIQLNVQHANVDYRLGPLQSLLSIGPVHRLHHVNWAGDGDVNFGLFLTVWDKMLGSFRPGSDGRPGTADIGIQGCPRFPQNYARQLKIPFEQGSPCDPEPDAEPSRPSASQA